MVHRADLRSGPARECVISSDYLCEDNMAQAGTYNHLFINASTETQMHFIVSFCIWFYPINQKMGWVSNERAMLISREIRDGMCRREHNVETQSQVPSITQKLNKRKWMHLNTPLYLKVIILYNFNRNLTCRCFLPLFCIKVIQVKQE